MNTPALRRALFHGVGGRLLRLRMLALLPLCLTFGCQLAYFLHSDDTKTIKAEYGKIGSKLVAVVVWADQTTLDMFPQAESRVCKAVTYHMDSRIEDAEFVEPSKIIALQRDGKVDWKSLSIRDLCERLKCDLVLRIDLTEYTTRAGDAVELRKGRIRATMNLYDKGHEEFGASLYDTEVVATYPPDSLHGSMDMGESQLLHEMEEYFAQLTAKKFYDHEESLHGPVRD